jgi:hypothetical protein
MKALVLLSGVFAPLFVWAQVTQPETVEEAVGLFQPLWDAIGNGQYLAAGAVITMIIVFAFRKWLMPKLNLGSGVLPIVSAFVGILSGAAVSVAGGADAGQAAMAVLSGPMAGMLWDSLFKYFFKKDT